MRIDMVSSKPFNESAQTALILLHNVMGLLTRLEERTYSRDAGVSYQQFLVLVTVEAADPPVTQTTIAKRLQRNLNTISMILDRMEKIGLVSRERSIVDRRESHVSLTKSGKAKLARALEVGGALRSRLGAGFSEEELQDSIRLITKLRNQVLKEFGKEPTEEGNERVARQKLLEVFKRGAAKGK